MLPLTISIETLGGISTPLVLRGTPLPTKRTQVFSTASDNQHTVLITVLMGESPLAAMNLHIAEFTLSGIPEALRGIPQIVVAFEVNEECKVKVHAVEKQSGLKVSVETSDTQPHLSDDRIKELLRQAEANKVEDAKQLKMILTKNKAEETIHRAEAHLQRDQEIGLRNETNDRINKSLASLGLALEHDDLEQVHMLVEELEKLVPSQADYSALFAQWFGASAATPGQLATDPFAGFWGVLGANTRRASPRATQTQSSKRVADRKSPKARKPTDKPTAPTHRHTVKLRENLVAHFNKEELRNLSFDLDIQYENLPETLDGMARELVAHCLRYGRFFELVEKCSKLRPIVSWEDES